MRMTMLIGRLPLFVTSYRVTKSWASRSDCL